MSSSIDCVVRSIAESLDSIPLSPETRERMLPDETKVASLGRLWHEEKAPTLRASDIPRLGKRISNPEVHNGPLPIPRVSPSQLALNSYSFLLSLGVLLSFFKVPLSTYVLMHFVQVKRLGLGKFYISHKGDLGFIWGNPSSRKGWMNIFFFVKRVGRRRNP
ncbi:hypothetical protein F511_15738 [Dorcoceras hygrometricum]|uniref:Uncharacterized protein n=1 Tax=Dorcoceras hygrometricum TaxID=472368 RepID=A0A2Z7CBH3_9LAMI|nr:hypothetical protein F511_15738 [Dorcoceras hygrometricum]